MIPIERESDPIHEWVRLYENSSSTTDIGRQYGVHSSTVSRRLARYLVLRDRTSACIAVSTKYEKTPFSDNREGAFLAGLVEDFHVRRAGRLVELSSTTTHPAMTKMFHETFEQCGHPISRAGYNSRGYYQYYLSVYLHNSYEPCLRKSDYLPEWVPKSDEDPLFRSYVSGLIAAEGCIRLYQANNRAHPVLHITINKPKLLSSLSEIIGGRLYRVARAWRLVLYGKAAIELLRNIDIRHEEKMNKARLVITETGKRWSEVETLWERLVCDIKLQVDRCKAEAKLDYIRKHGRPHPSEI